MILPEIVRQIARECDLERCTTDQYERAVRKFGEFLVRTPTVSDLRIDSVNEFLTHLKDIGKSGATIRKYRVAITRVWNLAVERGFAQPYDHRRLRSPKIQRKPVRAWSLSQIKILTDAAAMLPGMLRCGIPIGDLLRAWVRVGYDTGLRPIDLRMLEWSAIDLAAGRLGIVQHKTGRPHNARLSPTSIAALDAISSPSRSHVFPLSKGGMRRLELKLFDLARRLGFRRNRGQGLGTLRKTHATQIYEQEGEYAAAESLGHVGGTRTVRANYIDSRSIRQGRLPPDVA